MVLLFCVILIVNVALPLVSDLSKISWASEATAHLMSLAIQVQNGRSEEAQEQWTCLRECKERAHTFVFTIRDIFFGIKADNFEKVI